MAEANSNIYVLEMRNAIIRVQYRRMQLIAAFVVPFVLHLLVSLVAWSLHTSSISAWFFVVYVLCGFVLLERRLRLRAALWALLYVPVTIWLLFMFALILGGGI